MNEHQEYVLEDQCSRQSVQPVYGRKIRWVGTNEGETHPLQLINEPMAPDSRQLKPLRYAAPPQATNFEVKATRQIMTIYAQDKPVLSKPRFVLNPDRTKYWQNMRSRVNSSDLNHRGTYKREEDDCYQVLKFFHNRNGIAIVMRNN